MSDTNEVDTSELKEVRIPPEPRGLRPWKDEEKYQGDLKDLPLRIINKYMKMWLLWLGLRTNLRVEEILSQEVDRDSDDYYLRCIVVDLMDAMGKILSQTSIKEELAYLEGFRPESSEHTPPVVVSSETSPSEDP